MIRMCLTGGIVVIFGGVLAYASMQDRKYKLVRRYVWYVGCLLGILLILLKWVLPGVESASVFQGVCLKRIFDVLCFWGIQACLFSKMYGKADCYAFSCCSLVYAAFGGGMVMYLCHMLLSVFLLGMIQMLEKNVGKDGNLKNPVAFIPYISVSFFICLIGRWMFVG